MTGLVLYCLGICVPGTRTSGLCTASANIPTEQWGLKPVQKLYDEQVLLGGILPGTPTVACY
jgi:hypothetical protein